MNRLKFILGACAIIPCLVWGRVGIDSTGEKIILTGLLDGTGNTVSNIVLVNSSGVGLTNITAAQVGAVPTNDAAYLAALTNANMITTGTVWQVTLDSATRKSTIYVVTNVGDNLGNHTATQQVTWTVVSSVLTNLTLTGTTGAPVPDVTGVYTQIADFGGKGRWRNADLGHYVVYADSAYLIQPSDGSVGTVFPCWVRIETDPIGNYAANAGPPASTGTITVAYSYVTNTVTWRSGWDGTNWVVSSNGTTCFNATNVATLTTQLSLAGATNAINIVANAALPKAGGAMSGNINLAGTTVSNGGVFQAVTGDFTQVNAGNSTQWIAAASSEAYLKTTGGTMTTNGNINLNGATISNGIASVTALQITDGSPTNGAVMMATNSTGQGAWTRKLTKMWTLNTQITNTATITASGIGFRPSGATVHAEAELAPGIFTSKGFVDGSGTQGMMTTYAGNSMAGNSINCAALYQGSGNWKMTWTAFTDEGATFTPALTSTMSFTNITLQILFYP